MLTMDIKEFAKNRYNYVYDTKTVVVAKFLEKLATKMHNESKVPLISTDYDTWVGFTYDAARLLYELAKVEDPKEFVRGFNKGRDSILRQNVSGCVCKISENGEEIIEPCLLHKTWKEEK